DNQQHDIHKPCQPGCNTDLTYRRHVEYNIIIVAGFELRNEAIETSRQNSRQLTITACFRDRVKILLNQRVAACFAGKRVCKDATRFTLEEGMGSMLDGRHIHKQHVSVASF